MLIVNFFTGFAQYFKVNIAIVNMISDMRIFFKLFVCLRIREIFKISLTLRVRIITRVKLHKNVM